MSHPRQLAWLACSLVSIFAVALAVVLQLYLDLMPCPLCILQRYCFLVVAGMAFWRYLRPTATVAAFGALAGSILGMGIAFRHSWIIAHPAITCGIDPTETFLNKLPWASWAPALFEANGLCSDAGPAWLGLTFPNWAACAFVILTLALTILVRSALRKKG